MNKTVCSYLACCSCRSSLKKNRNRLYCSECGLSFPVVQGRPVIMTAEMVTKWKSPVDEALGLSGERTLVDSIRTLADLGLEGALEMIQQVPQHEKSFTSIEAVSLKDQGKMRYRGTGEWFRHCGREDKLLVFPWKKNEDGSFSAFMKAVQEESSVVLLDLASGGGFGLSQQAFLNKTARCIIGVEKDLKCLSNIQYRLKHIGKDNIADAVGGDVRHLPIMDESVDTAMMLAGLPEIHGISRLLKEVFRVLKPQGSFHLLIEDRLFISNPPFVSVGFSEKDFRIFAEAADLFSGGEQFASAARRAGFQVTSRIFSGSKRRRLLLLRKTS
ncbi:hypothetical protein CSA37_07840 [Candidatus Fermentibacteria bacterium]|nr:MAG: hypothetical protein CSA37_07840 [Candidatus Fermentibacteria bacterium]